MLLIYSALYKRKEEFLVKKMSSALDRNRSFVRDDSLEYFIKFPTPNFRHEAETAESDYVFVYNETNVPIVLLLGWAGCQDKYLMKYSKIYEDRGLVMK